MKTLLVEDIKGFDPVLIASLGADGDIIDTIAETGIMSKCRDAMQYDIIIIDVEGLRTNGGALIRSLRHHHVDSAVFVVAERSQIEDKIGFLDSGADDYLVKPINLREIKARLRSVIRRRRGFYGNTRRFGNLVIDSVSRTVFIDENRIELNPRELQLFELLISRLDQVVPKDRLMDQLFGAEDTGPNALELYVSRVRQKIRLSTVRIETVRCVGYVARNIK